WEVALKEIQPRHADSAVSRDRFRLEAEVTGRLEHPGIVPVYSLGSHADGRPYYAMRFIRGESLKETVTRFHERRGELSPATRAVEFRKLMGCFIDVCHTIAYAHSRGVLHRDIKPDNIMLGKYRETLVVDWGLAKAIGSDGVPARATDDPALEPCLVEARSAVTGAGAAIGTPVFMSPEQATGRPGCLDQRSDIYALGAVLYTILTGHAPIKSDQTAEALRKARAGEFESPRSVNPDAPRPLEAICLKAMALQPDDRYDSASDLAEDIEAWLADESVSAHREPVTARARRWLRRHQTPVAAFAAAALVAIVSLALSVAMLTTKNRQLLAANARETVAKNHAQQRFSLALEAIEGYYTGVSQEVLLKQAELLDLKTRLLHMPLDFYERLLADLASDASVESRGGLSDAYYAMAEILAECGSVDPALDAVRKAIAIRETLAAEHPLSAKYQWGLVAAYASLASIQSIAGNSLEALAINRQALDVTEGLAQRFPDHPGCQLWTANLLNNIASIQGRLNQWDAAETSMETAIQIRMAMMAEKAADDQQRRTLAGHYHNLALVRAAQGDHQAALQEALRAVDIQEQVRRADPESTAGRSDLAMGYYNLASHCRTLGKRPEAIAFYTKSIDLWERLVEEFPNVSAWQNELAKALNNDAELKVRQGEQEAGRLGFEKAMAIHQRLAQAHPKVPAYQLNLANHLQNMGTLHDNQGNPRDALDSFEQAIAIHEQLAVSFPDVADYRFRLSESRRSLGRLLRRTGQVERAAESFEKAVATCGQLLAQHPEAVAYRGQMALLLNSLALARQAAGHIDAARSAYDQAIDIGRRLVDELPKINTHAVTLGAAYCNRAHLEQEHADHTATLPWYSEAIQTLSTALARDAADAEARKFLLNSYRGRAK
ncbi:MAG: serine/threonine protein kinase, partial [Planctomycetes bacterium]|nr:serine/threonine protein kinase [Planctomycetota bacterium]